MRLLYENIYCCEYTRKTERYSSSVLECTVHFACVRLSGWWSKIDCQSQSPKLLDKNKQAVINVHLLLLTALVSTTVLSCLSWKIFIWIIFHKHCAENRIDLHNKEYNFIFYFKEMEWRNRNVSRSLSSNRVFHKHTRSAMLELLPTLFLRSCLFSLSLHQLMLPNVKLEIKGYMNITF